MKYIDEYIDGTYIGSKGGVVSGSLQTSHGIECLTYCVDGLKNINQCNVQIEIKIGWWLVMNVDNDYEIVVAHDFDYSGGCESEFISDTDRVRTVMGCLSDEQ